MDREQVTSKLESDRASLLGRHPVDTRRDYVCEWITLLSLLIMGPAVILFPGNQQDLMMEEGGFKNPELNHPLKVPTFSTSNVSIASWTVIFLVLCNRALDSEARKFGINATLREFAWSFGLQGLITNSIKIYVGRPRPNFFELCKWDETGCTTNERIAYRSFPSGHCSAVMAVFGLVCLHFVENVLLQLRGYKVPSERLDASRYGWLWNLFFPITRAIGPSAILIALLPGFFAICVIVSRIHDYWHFVGDALTGAIIGFSCALLAFSMFRKQVYLENSSSAKANIELPARG